MAEIYTITNKITGDVYVGNTSRGVKRRWTEHLCDARDDRRRGRKLYKAINEYGSSNFKVDVVEVCPSEMSMERERYWIDFYNSVDRGYNESYGGKGKNLVDYKEVCRVYDMTRCEKRTAEILGIDDNTVRTAIKANGKQPPTRKEAQYKTAKTVSAYTKSGEYIKAFASLHEASVWAVPDLKENRMRSEASVRKHISEVCYGERKSAYGYIWTF